MSASSSSKPARMTDGRSLARNTVVNLLGQGAPLLVGLVSIPMLLKAIGAERFGLLSISWLIIGYFSLFDLGLGRAITKLVAEELGKGREKHIGPIVWTALTLMIMISALGGGLIAALTPWLTSGVIKIPPELRIESRDSFFLLAAAIPVVTLSAGLRGLLEAFHKFGLVNLIQVSLGVLNFLGPLAVALHTQSMPWIILVLVLGRVVTCFAFFVGSLSVLSEEARRYQYQKSLAPLLLKFGGWLTVSNIISPLMTYCDRFLISSMLAIGAVAYYTTPYEMVTRLWIVPGAITRVLFPAFSAGAAAGAVKIRQLFSQGLRGIFIFLFPVIFVLFAFATEGMALWLGRDFGLQSAPILRWLAVGVLINSLAWVPYVYLQTADRAASVAKLHLIELPLYLGLLWLCVKQFGIEGAAIAWVLRLVFDMIALFALAVRTSSAVRPIVYEYSPFFMLCLTLLGATKLIGPLPLRIAFTLISLVVFTTMTWFRFMKPMEREALLRMVRLRHARPLLDRPAIFRCQAALLVPKGRSVGADELSTLRKEFESVVVAHSADELNAYLENARVEGKDWLAVFDLASFPSRHYLASFRTFLRSQAEFHHIGMLLPTKYDFEASLGYRSHAPEYPSTIDSWGWGALLRCDAVHDIGGFPADFSPAAGLTEIWLKLKASGYSTLCSPETLIHSRAFPSAKKHVLGMPLRPSNLSVETRKTLSHLRGRLYLKYFWRAPLWVMYDLRSAMRDLIKIAFGEQDRSRKVGAIVCGMASGLIGKHSKKSA